jgi:hypothetical protein
MKNMKNRCGTVLEYGSFVGRGFNRDKRFENS